MKHQEFREFVPIEFTPEQEFANILIHLVGILFGVIAIPFLISLAAQNHDTSRIISISVYGLCFLMVFTCSTTYHALKKQAMRAFFKKLDRISIYFLIAGTYTPIIRFYLFDGTGIFLLIILWTLVVFGTLFEIFFPDKFNVFSVTFYLLMGLIFVFVPDHFFASMPNGIIVLVLSGVVLYCFGVVFYLWQKWRFHHAIWHSFVLSAGICHYLAVLHTVS